MLRNLAILALVVGLSACSQQQGETVPAEEWFAQNTRPENADIATLEVLAEQGDLAAQIELSNMYRTGVIANQKL